MAQSNILLGRLTDIQSDTASAIYRMLRNHEATKGVEVSTQKERYFVKPRTGGCAGAMLNINDGIDDKSEFTMDTIELICILEALEKMYYED